EVADGTQVVIAGLITGLQRRITREGKSWAIATVEDLSASIEVLFFPKSYEIFGGELAEGGAGAGRGRINRRENAVTVVGMDLMVLDLTTVTPDGATPVVVVAEAKQISPELVEEFRRILVSHHGSSPVQLRLRSPGGGSKMFA